MRNIIVDELIKKQDLDPTNKEYTDQIISILYPNATKCKITGKNIVWPKTAVSYTRVKKIYQIHDKSFLSSIKPFEIDYSLKYSYEGAKTLFPDLDNKNLSRLFNTYNLITTTLFEIPNDIKDKKNQDSLPSLNKCIEKHGTELGPVKWKEYCTKLSVKNSFEFMSKKRGWTKEQFDEYNKSRGVTLELSIQRHGEEKGKEAFEQYKRKQAYSNTHEYFIKKYGEEKGKIKYNNARCLAISKSSQDLFDELDILIHHLNLTTFYSRKNHEMNFKINSNLFFLDFYIKELNLCIEYNGDFWHANPLIFDKDFVNMKKGRSAEEIWELDKKRIELLKTYNNIDTIVIWESDCIKNREKVLEDLKNKIENLCNLVMNLKPLNPVNV